MGAHKTKSKLPWGELLLGAAVGFIIGIGYIFVSDALFDHALKRLSILAMLFFFIIGFTLHLVLHELGHLLFGRITGYHFVSFRIGSFTLIRYDGSYRMKRYTLPGTLGQCLMAPPDCLPEQCPYLWYNLGGGVINLLLSLLALAVAAVTPYPYLALFLVSFSMAGIILGLTNLFPMEVGGVANDGKNTLTLSKSPSSRRMFYQQLRINAFATQGQRYSEMPEEWFTLPESPDYRDAMVASLASMRIARWIYQNEPMHAKQLAQELLSNPKLIGLIRMEVSCELLYIACICADEVLRRQLDTKQLRHYIKASKTTPSRQRLLYVLALADKDIPAAQTHLEKINKAAASYPVIGEAVDEIQLIQMLKSDKKGSNTY